MNYRKLSGWILAVVTVCAVAWLLATRWNVWFGNAPEAAYVTPGEPHHILLTMGSDEHSRLVTWQCDTMIQQACVEYSYTNDTASVHDIINIVPATAQKFTSQGGSSVFYKAPIPTPASGKYSYRIVHPNAQSQWYSFEVSDMGNERVRFAFIGDIQDTINGVTKDIMQEIVHNHPDREFYLLGGDLIHRPQEVYWDEFFRGISPIATSYPVAAVSGNHEYLKGWYKKCEARFPLHFAYFEDGYNREDYCFKTIKYDNVELFLLDSHCDIFRLNEQVKALDEALSQSVAAWKIVVLHHPPYSIRRKNNNIHLRWLLRPVLEKYAVELVLSGHEHGYARIAPHEDSGLPIYTISHCSPKSYTHHNTMVGVYDNCSRYYQLIDCTPDTMSMRTYTQGGYLIDKVMWVKQSDQTIIL